MLKTHSQLGIDDKYEAIAHTIILKKIKIKSILLLSLLIFFYT